MWYFKFHRHCSYQRNIISDHNLGQWDWSRVNNPNKSVKAVSWLKSSFMGKLFLKLFLWQLTTFSYFYSVYSPWFYSQSSVCQYWSQYFFSFLDVYCFIVPFNIPFVNWWKEALSACSCRSSSPFYTSPQSSFSAPLPFEFIFLVKNCKKYFRRHLFSALFGSNSTFSLQYFFLPSVYPTSCIQWALRLSQLYRRNSDSSCNWLFCLCVPTSLRSEDITISAVAPHFPLAVIFRS